MQDLIYNFNPIADDGDATLEHDEAAAPPTEGRYDESRYEINEADANDIDYLKDLDQVLLLAASIPLPEHGDLEQGIEDVGPFVDNVGAGDAAASISTGVAEATFSLRCLLLD